MRHLLPGPELLERSPELAALAILEAALAASELALLGAHAELLHGGDFSRGSSAQHAEVVITQARRLATALAAYRQALHRDARREERERRRASF